MPDASRNIASVLDAVMCPGWICSRMADKPNREYIPASWPAIPASVIPPLWNVADKEIAMNALQQHVPAIFARESVLWNRLRAALLSGDRDLIRVRAYSLAACMMTMGLPDSEVAVYLSRGLAEAKLIIDSLAKWEVTFGEESSVFFDPPLVVS